MTDTIIDTELDDETKETLDRIAEDITPSWMDETVGRQDTINFLAQYYYGEVDE